MVALLSLLLLLVSAALAALLAWLGTRSQVALLSFLAFAVASGGILAAAIDENAVAGSSQDTLAVGSEATQTTEVLTQEATSTSVIPTAIPTLMPTETATPAAIPDSPFVLEPATPEDTFGAPTSFTIGDEGELYVGHNDGIVLTRDTTGDGFYDTQTHFGLEGGWVFGLDYHEGSLYAAVQGNVLRLTDFDGDDVADEVFTMAEGLPHNRHGGHSNSGLQVGPDGLLYMTVGGTSDHGPELEPLGGTILVMPLDGSPETGPPALYASGFRNPYDIAFCPDGRLFASDNGPDQLDEELTFRPWDEVNLIQQGGNYGYPDYFGPVPPETGTISPVARLAPSAGATGIACYSGAAYPAEYQGNLFVTLWGTFTYPVESGRRVMRVQLEETPEGTSGTAVEFIGGFGHPIDVIEDPQGHLLVLDYERGQILRIRYTGA